MATPKVGYRHGHLTAPPVRVVMFPVGENVRKTERHKTFSLACGVEDAPLMIFVHGWPELAISWRHQLPCFADLGFRAVAPDMRGYGRSSVYSRHEDYALEQSVADLIELLDALGREKAVWVGHDWGSPVVWSLASHHPERCIAVANLCVPFRTIEYDFEGTLELADRELYPVEKYPAAQWEYMRFYEENFDKAVRVFEANIDNSVRC